jgi:SagB-type dehydrogenase family enzyme
MKLRDYHERTKHSVASVRAGSHGLDWDNQPLPFKIYPELPEFPLPTDLPGSQRPALEALGGSISEASRPMDAGSLAHFLYFSAGVLRRRTYPGGTVYYRAAACTGALYHVDVYVAAGTLEGLGAGLYHFGAHDFALRRLREGDSRSCLVEAAAGEPHMARAPVLLALTSTFWRNAWKYGARTYRHCFWDAGTIIANLLAVAAALDVPAYVVTGFVDASIARLLDIDTSREVPLALVALGASGAPAPAPAPIAPLGYTTLPLSASEVDYPILGEAHTASALASPDDVVRWRSRPEEPNPQAGETATRLEPLPSGAVREPIEAVIVRRGSARRFSHASIPLPALATILHAARGESPLDVHARSTCYLIVNAVDGLASGAYAETRDGGLDTIRLGDFRRDAGFLGLGQQLPADAAACLYWLVDLEPVFERLGDRGYRAAQLEAAIAGGRAYLAAYALGLGATGLTFFDDDVTRFFSPHAAGKSVMFHVAIGRAGRRPLA